MQNRLMILVHAGEIRDDVSEVQPWQLGPIAGLPWSRVQDSQASCSWPKLLFVMPSALL